MPADKKTDLDLVDAETITLETVGPAIITGITGIPKGALEIQMSERQSMHIPCADGTVVEIKPGRSKIFFCRKDDRFHLLDCTCPTCRPPAPESP